MLSASSDPAASVDAATDGDAAQVGEGTAELPVARVRGVVHLELPPAPSPDAAQPDAASAEAEAGAAASPGAPPEEAVGAEREVELGPPAAGSCRIRPWQRGTPVGAMATCDAAGAFEVVLDPGVGGPTAFEVEVPGHLRAVVVVDVPVGGIGRLPPVALGPAQSVRGHVVDGRGEPVAGALLEAMPVPNLGEPEPWRTTSGDDGAFAFDTLPSGTVTMRISKPGYTPTLAEAIAGEDDLLVVLEKLVELRGTVVGPRERLAQTRVRLEGGSVWPAREVPVAPDGSFVIDDIPDDVYALEAVVTSEDDAGPSLASVPLENVTVDLEATLALTQAVMVPVRVVEPDGDPVALARVTLGNSQIGLLQRLGTTDAQGRVQMGPVVPGDYVLRADADGYLLSDPLRIRLDVGEVPEQTLVVATPARIAGRVVDDEGRPVEGAAILVSGDALYTPGESLARSRMFETALVAAAGSLGVTQGPVPEIPLFAEEARSAAQPVSDADGRFTIGDLVPGTYRLRAVHGLYAQSEEVAVRLPAPGTVRTVELVLRSGHRLTGRVVDGNGRPIFHAKVVLGDGSTYFTDDTGVFDAGFRRGTVELVAHAQGKAPRKTTVRMRGAAQDVEIALPDARARVEGRVQDGNGRPIEGVEVSMHWSDGLGPSRVAFTDDRGIYRFEDLPGGVVELEIVHPAYLEQSLRLRLADDTAAEAIDATLVPGWDLEVVVVEQGTGAPVSGALVRAGNRSGLTASDGRVTLKNLAGDAVVEVNATGLSGRRATVREPAGDVESLVVELVPGGGLRGTVVDYAGDPVPGAEVVVRDLDGSELARVRTSAAGTWSVDGLPEGDVDVEAYPPPGREVELAEVAQRSDVLRGHVTQDVDLRFDRR